MHPTKSNFTQTQTQRYRALSQRLEGQLKQWGPVVTSRAAHVPKPMMPPRPSTHAERSCVLKR